MRHILRIECHGGGLYRADGHRNPWGEVVGVYDGCSAHPLPQDDSGISCEALDWLHANQEHARFGFTCVAQLRRWVYYDEWVVSLSEAGAELVVYEVPDECFCGYTQVIFNMTTAIELDRQPLSTILTGGANGSENVGVLA